MARALPVVVGMARPRSRCPTLAGAGEPVLVTGAWAQGLRQGCRGGRVIYCTLLRAEPGDSQSPGTARAWGQPGLCWTLLLSSQSCAEVPVAAAHLTLSKNCS